ncbi:MAG: DUF1905 domain-containing protein [Acidobacteriota bacterium]|nr:DUF1905 domain-containing protein [Acidobacteriota bacterium]
MPQRSAIHFHNAQTREKREVAGPSGGSSGWPTNKNNGVAAALLIAANDETGDALKKYRFKAKIEAGDGGGAYVLFPYDIEKEFATKGKVPVNATFDGVPYTGSLISMVIPYTCCLSSNR